MFLLTGSLWNKKRMPTFRSNCPQERISDNGSDFHLEEMTQKPVLILYDNNRVPFARQKAKGFFF